MPPAIDSGLRVVSNACANGGGALDTSAGYWNPSTFSADQEAQITVTTLPVLDNYGLGVYLRTLPGTDTAGYMVDWAKNRGTGGVIDAVVIWRLDPFENIQQADLAMGVGDTLRVTAIGNTITVYHTPFGGGESLITSVVDAATNRVGYIGAIIYGSTVRADDFGGGSIDPCAFPTTSILDDFNRANEGPPPSASWHTLSGFGGLKVESNKAVNSDADSGCTWGTSYGPDCEAYSTLSSLSGTGDIATWSIALFARASSADVYDGDCYRLLVGNGNIGGVCSWYLQRMLFSTGTVDIATGTVTFSIGDSIGISAIGNTITAYYKSSGGSWASLGSAVNGDVPGAGYIGADLAPDLINTTQMGIDDFGGGTYTCSPAPVADFSGTPTSGTAGLSVDFTDLSTNTPTSWLWDFGDGDISTDQNPTHVYSAIGTYTVALTATNGDGSDTETKVDYITVIGAPVADFSGTPTSGNVALSVDFTDLSTNSPTSWFWDFGDGGSSTSQNPTYVYNYIGVYTVTLTATSSSGSDSETKVAYITVNAAPEVGAAEVEDCDTNTGGLAVGLRVSNVAIARDNWLGSLTIDASAELRAKDNSYSVLVNNGTLTSLVGDKSVWDTDNFAAGHAKDIDDATGQYHLVSAATQAYTISNPSTDRAYDVTATTLNELAAIVGTLIADLKAKGLLS